MSLKYILGIETSCDETSASVIDSNLKIISNIIYSQQKLHSNYYGVVPELASRAHYEKINFVIKESLKKIKIDKIGLISYTCDPGLRGSLLIGKIVAETLGYIYKIPVVGVNHLWGHINSLFLSNRKITFPFLSLIISGGHTELSLVLSYTKRKILGNTRDDAVGESFDKVAKMLNLSYPGGPVIERLAKKGDKNYIFFKRPYMLESWDFSFSGIKTSVLYYLQDLSKNKVKIDKQLISNICASFQEAICDTLATKLLNACDKLKCNTVGISGGVSANEYIRKYIEKKLNCNKIKTFFPDKNLSTDNAAMIASAGRNLYF
ncbi:MAG: tRNA (adenosine(37)-N6)-threonylcarbamoyltransferase complex transferase subunit TsaD [Endomicrobiia bacterium]